MKQIFRFFRGELNGFFLRAVCTFLNEYASTSGLLGEFAHQKLFQWVLAGFEANGKTPIRESDLYNLGKIGGLFPPRTMSKSSIGSIWFAPSSKVLFPEYPERSERGLVRKDYEDFMFVRVERNDYPTDISVEASEDFRMTYRDKGAKLLGYVATDGDLFSAKLFDKEGTVNVDAILPYPPTDQAYVEFYGLKYAFYEETFDMELPLTPDVYKLLFEAIQRIRRSGPSIKALLDLTQIMGEGYIMDLELVRNKHFLRCEYSLDDSMQVYNRERRYAAWIEVCKMKFKEIHFVNRDTGGT